MFLVLVSWNNPYKRWLYWNSDNYRQDIWKEYRTEFDRVRAIKSLKSIDLYYFVSIQWSKSTMCSFQIGYMTLLPECYADYPNPKFEFASEMMYRNLTNAWSNYCYNESHSNNSYLR